MKPITKREAQKLLNQKLESKIKYFITEKEDFIFYLVSEGVVKMIPIK